MVSNPHFYGQSTTGTPNQIEDGVDFPHTGIIKALADGLGQNYAISGFDITFDSPTQIDVALGVIFRDGKRHEISAGNNLALGRTTASENSYHLVVVDKDNAIAIRSPSAKDKVADYTVRTLTSGTSTAHKQGDTIIAVVVHNGSNPAPVQYLTVDKAENSLSIGYSNSGTYAEGLTIDTDAGDTTIENKVSDKDVIFKVNDGGVSSESMRIDGDINQVKVKSLGIGTAAELTITESSDDITIKNTVADKDIIFNINDSDGGGDTEIMRLDGSTSRVGIGTNAPVAPLHVMTSNTDETLRLQSDDATATTAPDLIFHRNSASPAASDGIGHLKFLGRNAANNADIMYAAMYASIRDTTAGQEDGSLIFTTETAGSDRNRIAIMPTEVNINDNGQALNFRVESDSEQNMLLVDGTNNRIGIKESIPDTDLHMKSGTTVEPTITLENTNADGSSSGIHFVKNSASPAVGDDLGVIKYTGDNTVGGVHQFAEILTEATNVTNGAETSKFTFKVSKAGTLIPVMQITDTEVMVNDNAISSNTLNFRAQSNNNQNMLFVDATNDRIGVGTNTPAATVDVAGDLRVTNNIFQQHKDMTNDLAVGWHTVAHIKGRSGGSASGSAGSAQRGIAQIIIKEESSSRHALYEFKVNHLFGTRNAIQLENSAYFSTKIIQQVRIKENDTYDGAVFQIYVTNATNNLQVFITDNFADHGWTANDAVADTDNTGHNSLGLGYNNAYSTFSVVRTYNLDDLDVVDAGTIMGGNAFVQGNLKVNTGATFRSPRLPTVSVSASTTLTESTHAGAYLICAGNVTLPSTSDAGLHFTILNTTGGNITVGRNGNSINGATSDITVGTYNGVTCIAIGSNNWIALGV